MELHAEQPVVDAEGLDRVRVGGGEQGRAPRQVEGVAVPLHHRHAREVAQRRSQARLRRLDRAEADLAGRSRVDALAARRGDQLSAEADPEGGQSEVQPVLQQGDLGGDEGVVHGLVDAGARAERDDEVGVDDVDGAEIRAGHRLHLEAQLPEDRVEDAETGAPLVDDRECAPHVSRRSRTRGGRRGRRRVRGR